MPVAVAVAVPALFTSRISVRQKEKTIAIAAQAELPLQPKQSKHASVRNRRLSPAAESFRTHQDAQVGLGLRFRREELHTGGPAVGCQPPSRL